MNDKIKGIIVCTVVLACLGGTLGILKLTGADSADSSSADSSSKTSTSSKVDESVKLVEAQASDIVKITAVNEFGGFTYIGESESGKDSASIEELKGLELTSSKLSDIAEDAANLTAYKLVESQAEDLSKYGLETPSAEFTITFRDGSERTFYLGDIAPQNRYRYICEKDSSDVYMIIKTTISYYVERKEEFINRTLLATPSDDSNFVFGKLTLSRKDLDYDMSFEEDDGTNEKSSSNMASAQVMTEPIFSYLNGTTSSDVIYSLFGLTAMEATVIFPTEEDIAEYELDDPVATVTFVGEGYDYKLDIGKAFHEENDDGELQTEASAYYCYFSGVEGKDCIWKIDATALPWVDLVPGDIISTLMTWNNIVDVSEINISGEENAKITLTTEGEGDEKDITSAQLDGEDTDVYNIKSLYQYILTCPTSEIYFTDPETEPYLTIEIKTADGGDKIELFKDTDRRSIVKLNGETKYKIQSKWVDRLIKNIGLVRNGEDVVEDY